MMSWSNQVRDICYQPKRSPTSCRKAAAERGELEGWTDTKSASKSKHVLDELRTATCTEALLLLSLPVSWSRESMRHLSSTKVFNAKAARREQEHLQFPRKACRPPWAKRKLVELASADNAHRCRYMAKPWKEGGVFVFLNGEGNGQRGETVEKGMVHTGDMMQMQ